MGMEEVERNLKALREVMAELKTWADSQRGSNRRALDGICHLLRQHEYDEALLVHQSRRRTSGFRPRLFASENLFFGSNGGWGGIRTLGRLYNLRRFSKPVP